MTRSVHQSGFTMAEALVASAVLASAVLAVSVALNAGQRQMQESLVTQRASKLAEEMMEFIVGTPYSDPQGASVPGPEAGESGVANFDNADDFHGYSEAAGTLKDAAGNLYGAEYQVFSLDVTAAYDSETVSALGGTIAGLRVTVTVRNSAGRAWTLTRFIPQPVGAS